MSEKRISTVSPSPAPDDFCPNGTTCDGLVVGAVFADVNPGLLVIIRLAFE